MAYTENNPFRRASYLENRALSINTVGGRNSQVIRTSTVTSESHTTIVESPSAQQPSLPSPVPEYSRMPPPAHIVVGGDIVSTMPANYSEEGNSVRVDISIGGDFPPPYQANAVPASPPPTYDPYTLKRTSRGLEIRVVDIDPEHVGPVGRTIDEAREANEAERRRLERSTHRREKFQRASGIWALIRYCIPKTKRQSRKCYIASGSLLVVLITGMFVFLVVKFTSKDEKNGRNVGDGERLNAEMLNLPGFPPIPTGYLLMQPTTQANKRTSCVSPPELWSCNLPIPNDDPIPEFRFEIRHRPTDKYRSLGPESFWQPRPPSVLPLDYQEMAQIDDIRSNNTAGQETQFIISMLNNNGNQYSMIRRSEVLLDEQSEERQLLARELQLLKRQSIADPSRNPPNMLPFMLRNQPLRLMDQGLSTEHYTTHTYFQKSIYLDSINRDQGPPTYNNEVHGASENAKWACIYSYTRFKINIYTRRNEKLVIMDRQANRMGIDKDFGMTLTNKRDAILPYPVTVSEDRVGGSANEHGRHMACYAIEPDGNGGKKLGKRYSWPETKGNDIGQPEGRQRGCFCEWTNWRERGRLDGKI